MARELFTGFIGSPGACTDQFFDNVDQNTVRAVNAIPQFQPAFDQQAEITDVYYILKGSQQAPGAANTLQFHVVVCNKQGGGFNLTPPFLFFRVLIAEL